MNFDARAQLIRLANHFGADPEYARAGGGNASVKSDEILHIKPSGTTLADLRTEDLVPLRLAPLLESLVTDDPTDGDPAMAAAERARIGAPGGPRPSVELLFHALIPDPMVLHLHPLVANAVTCNTDGRALTTELLGDDAIWVDYVDPGIPLARAIATARLDFESRTGLPAPGITMLGNHGIIVSGDSFEQVAARTTWLTETIAAAISASGPVPATTAASSSGLEGTATYFRDATEAPSVVFDADEFIASTTPVTAGPISRGPLIPDQIVYAGSMPVLLGLDDDADAVILAVGQFRKTHGRSPIIAVVPEVAAFAVGGSDRAARTALDTYRDALRVARDADRLGQLRVMDERERHFIEHWEAEAYRRAVAAS